MHVLVAPDKAYGVPLAAMKEGGNKAAASDMSDIPHYCEQLLLLAISGYQLHT